jgi:hypothetical protein
MSADIEKRLVTYMMLAHFHDQANAKPKHTELRLVKDGWEVWGGEVEEPIPVHPDYAYEISGYDQRVLDETRRLCGEMRARAKRSKVARKQLEDLRAGLARAREIKAKRAAPSGEKGQRPS